MSSDLSSSSSSHSLRSETTYAFRDPIDDDASVSSNDPPEPDAPVTAPVTMSIVLAGVTYTKNATKKVVSETIVEQVLHKKQDREKLPAEDRTSLFEKAVKNGHKKFDLLPLALNDEEKLDDTYSLEVLIRKMKRQHCTFDMQDVFTIIYPDPVSEAIVATTLDLYTEFAKISIEDVARSNLWYREWLSDPWFEENLQLSYDYFQQNVSDDLWMKVCETYDQYKVSEQGGPLFFILMMNHLLSDTEEAASSLVARLHAFKITNVQGEDIYKVVSLLRGACNRLRHINKLPEDIVKILLTVFQTSSVDSFNETFHLLQKTRKHAAVLRKTGSSPDLTLEGIFKLAESDYRDLCQDSLWSGATTTGGNSAFTAEGATGGPPTTPTSGGGGLACFNCGGPHRQGDCPNPKDEARIQANLAKFRAGRAARNGKTGKAWERPHKYRLPEAGENDRRVIDGKPHQFNAQVKKWLIVSAVPGPGANLAGNDVTPPESAAPPGTPAGGAVLHVHGSPDKARMMQLAVANTAKAVNAAFANLAEQFD
jgi:hypothetical protein